MVPVVCKEESEARQLLASPTLLPGLSSAFQVRRMLGPFSSRPPEWELVPAAELQLELGSL